MGEITEHEDLISDTSARSRALGTDQWRSQGKREKRHDEEVALHAKRVIDALHDLALLGPFDRLIIAGTKKATAQLARLLPRRLQGKLVRTITMPVTASKKRRSSRASSSSSSGWSASRRPRLSKDSRPSSTTAARRLPASARSSTPSTRVGCGSSSMPRVSRSTAASAPNAAPTYPNPRVRASYCGGKVEKVAQCLDRLSQSVFDMAGKVEVVDGPAAKRLAKHDSIAALLRY